MTADTVDSTLQRLVTKLSYRSRLDADDRAAIFDLPFTVRAVERHQFIARERERVTHCSFMLSGYSIRSKLVATGGRQIVGIHLPGDMVDLQSSLLEVADHSVQMLTGGKVAVIPRDAIQRLCAARPAVARAMWTDTLVDGSIFREWITNVGRRDARTRIAYVLCEFSLRMKLAGLGENDEYELPMTQEQLADATGLTSVHVNRTIKLLDSEALIERSSPRAIHIGDWKKLAEAGDFDSNYMHLKEDEPRLQ